MIWVSGPDGAYTWVNRQWREFTGRPLDAHLGDGWAADVHPDDVDRFVGAYHHAFDEREPFEAEVRLRRDDGRYRWMLARGTPRHDGDNAFMGYVGTCTDIGDRRDAEALVRFLAQVGDILTSSFDAEATLPRVARLVVSQFADLCTIAVAEPDGRVRRVAIAHTDPAEEARLRAADVDDPVTTADGSAIAEAMRTGVPVYRPLVDAPGPDEPWPPSEQGRDGRSLVVAPLASGRGTLGACAMVSWDRRYSPGDVALVQEVARRCAAAVDTAHLFRELEERRERLALLASVGEELASTLELEDTTRRVLERVVPSLADFGVVALGDRGEYARVDVHSIDRADRKSVV